MEKHKILFFDLETTGINPESDQIVELSMFIKDGDDTVLTYTKRFNPGMHIPESATAVHGITDEDVKDCPSFASEASELMVWFEGCVIAGYNILKFDLPFLYAKLVKAGIDWDYAKHEFIDVMVLEKRLHPQNLAAVYERYFGEPFDNAHSAEADVLATIAVFEAQKKESEELAVKTANELTLHSNYDKPLLDFGGKFAHNEQGEIIITFGKNKDQLAKNCKDYLQWMMGADFGPDVKNVCKKVLDASISR